METEISTAYWALVALLFITLFDRKQNLLIAVLIFYYSCVLCSVVRIVYFTRYVL